MDIKFQQLTNDDVIHMRQYFRGCKLYISNYSAAFKIMWQRYINLEYAYVEGCVVFREFYLGRSYFHYPMEMEVGQASKAMDALEDYCRTHNERIRFANISRETLGEFIDRYGIDMRITNKRIWRDYLYRAQDFVEYPGKKFSGQRNHVNKFKKLYADYAFITLHSSDSDRIAEFLKRFEKRQLDKGTAIAREELLGVYDILPHLDDLGLYAGALTVQGEIIALSIGERCGDQLIVHVEKALTDYEGAYPTMAQEFAKCFVTEGINYINREDDAGDAGLRKSKLQYNPVRLVDKFNVYPKRTIEKVTHIPVLTSDRLTMGEITEEYAARLYRLEFDGERNKYWGYNWREHISSEKDASAEYFLQGLREDFKNRDEIPMGIFSGNVMVGEVVLHNFGYRNDCEIGVRLLPEYEGMGYAKEALTAVIRYAFFELQLDTVLAKCYKQNERSRNTLLSVGLRPCGEDETFYYFKKTAAM